jgi:predicted phosphoadenosine phosphosulfate sulfurtransferase
VHLLDAAGQLLRILFLDPEGHYSATPHYVPREQALILASKSLLKIWPPLPKMSSYPFVDARPIGA